VGLVWATVGSGLGTFGHVWNLCTKCVLLVFGLLFSFSLLIMHYWREFGFFLLFFFLSGSFFLLAGELSELGKHHNAPRVVGFHLDRGERLYKVWMMS
jgi:hypothetical protein